VTLMEMTGELPGESLHRRGRSAMPSRTLPVRVSREDRSGIRAGLSRDELDRSFASLAVSAGGSATAAGCFRRLRRGLRFRCLDRHLFLGDEAGVRLVGNVLIDDRVHIGLGAQLPELRSDRICPTRPLGSAPSSMVLTMRDRRVQREGRVVSASMVRMPLSTLILTRFHHAVKHALGEEKSFHAVSVSAP